MWEFSSPGQPAWTRPHTDTTHPATRSRGGDEVLHLAFKDASCTQLEMQLTQLVGMQLTQLAGIGMNGRKMR